MTAGFVPQTMRFGLWIGAGCVFTGLGAGTWIGFGEHPKAVQTKSVEITVILKWYTLCLHLSSLDDDVHDGHIFAANLFPEENGCNCALFEG